MTLLEGTPVDKVVTAALFVAPTLLLLSSIIGASGAGIGVSAPSGLVMNLAFVGYALVALKLTSLVAPRPTLAAALLVVAFLGVAGGIGFGVNAWSIDAGGVSLDEASTLGGVAIKAFGVCFPLSLMGFGLGLLLARSVPAPVALALVLGGMLFPMGRISGVEVLVFACDLVLLAAFVAVAATGSETVPGQDPAASQGVATPQG